MGKKNFKQQYVTSKSRPERVYNCTKKERLFFFQFVGFSWSHFVKIPTNGQSNCRKCVISTRQGRTHYTICLPSAFFPPSLLSPKCASESHSALKRTSFYKWLYISYNAIRKCNIWVLYGEKKCPSLHKTSTFQLASYET